MTADSNDEPNSLSRLASDFDDALSRDPSTRVEEFLGETRTDESVRALLAREMSFRLRQDEMLSEEEFSLRFPELKNEISSLLGIAQSSKVRSSALPAVAARLDRNELGDYQLLEIIGRGGMGIVYKARQKSLNRLVAVKTIVSGPLANREETRRFKQEAEAAARLNHQGIVPVIEIGESDGVVFFSMGYVDGESLAQRLERNTLTPGDAAKIVKKLAEAVHFAHQAGVVHRDLKPANILIGQNEDPKISDFGLAKLVDQEGMTMTGAVFGTPSYMSPEQAAGLSGKVDRRTDIYGLGAILYACLCGQAPFRGPSTMATLKMVLNQRPVSLRQLRTDIPADLETICEKCLEKEPASRYQSAEALAEELDRFLEGRPILARPVPVWTRLGQWCRRKPVVAGLTAAVAMALLMGTIVSSYFAMLAERRAITAEEGKRVAKAQSELALATLKTIIRKIQVDLKEIPEARDVRKQLLLQMLGDLRRVSNGYVAQASVDRESAKVLTDLADLYTIVGGELGSNVAELSEANYRKAVEVYSQLWKENPEDESLMKEAFEAMLNSGDTAREYQQFELAIWAHRQGRDLATHWHQAEPENPDAQLAFVKSSEALGEALLRAGRTSESETYCQDAVRLAEKYAEANPTPLAFDNLARCYCTAGDMFRAQSKYDQAEQAYQQMCQMTLKLMELEPDNPKLLGDRSTDFERLGDLEMSRQDYDKALHYFEQCLHWIEKYIADDPENLYRLQESTWAYSKLAKVYQARGDTERSEWALKKLADIRKRLGRDEQ